MKTRWGVVLIALATALPSARAVAAPAKIGLIASTPPTALAAIGNRISTQLEKRGLIRDRDFTFDIQSAEGEPERLPALAKGLVSDGVTVIVARSYPAARAAKNATATIPIVIEYAGEPVETGLAKSLAKPGGNVTGLSDMSSELSTKRLELLRQAVPGMKKVAMLWNADDLGMTGRYNAAAAAAKAMGITIEALGVREPNDFGSAFDVMNRDRPDGILMVTDVLTLLNRKRVLDYAAAHKLPAIYEIEGLTREGGLMSYGADDKEVTSRLADLVAHILRGAEPADLPFERPTRFVFAINLKTASAIGLTIPQLLLTEADEVIE